ncbi:MAG: restriction endonuclease subunit S [Gammaproteobacteria bacterium]|nr:restriction endonuclease subunit S [Gammaproteobacteria bacterium]
MSEYPSDWKVVPLEEVAEIVGGGTPSRYDPTFWGSDHYWITPSEVVARDGGNVGRSKEMISKIGLDYSSAKLHPPGTILMTSRASIGYAAIAETEISTNQGFQSIRCGMMLDNRFALHQIRHRRPEFYKLAAGSTFLEISGSNVRSLPFVIPPLPEQKKIAEILSGIDSQIFCLKTRISTESKTRNAVLESLFQSGLREVEEGDSSEWTAWTVKELLFNCKDSMRSGPFGSALLKHELVDSGIPLLGIDNVHTEMFVPVFKRHISVLKFDELRKYEVFPGDVMITIMGTVGRSCVVPEKNIRCISSKYTWTMTFDNQKVVPEIVCWQLNHFSSTRGKFLSSSQGGVMDAISSAILRETIVPLPKNLETQQKIAYYYKVSLKYQDMLKQKLKKVEHLKMAIAADLLSGRKRVTI